MGAKRHVTIYFVRRGKKNKEAFTKSPQSCMWPVERKVAR